MRKIKYVLLLFLGYSPVVLSSLGLLYIWFIGLPYHSSFYYYNSIVLCRNCDIQLGVADEFCQRCGKSVQEIAYTVTSTHCDYCSSNSLYKNNDTEFCVKCGKALTASKEIMLSAIGYNNIRDYRTALIKDSIPRLFSNKIVGSFLIILFGLLSHNTIKQWMIHTIQKTLIANSIKRQEKGGDFL